MDFKKLLQCSFITVFIPTIAECLNNGLFTNFVPGVKMIQCMDGSFSTIKCRPGHKFRDCPFGYQCDASHYIKYAGHAFCGVCCPAPPVCPYGVRSGPYCGALGQCPLGYSCHNGICCQTKKVTCPKGTFLEGRCDYKNRCRPGFFCFDGACCSLPKPIRLKIDSCPVYYTHLRGIWCNKHHHCPGEATCVHHQCCQPITPLPQTTPPPKPPHYPRPIMPYPEPKYPPVSPTKPDLPPPEPKPEPIKPVEPGKPNPPTVPPTLPPTLPPKVRTPKPPILLTLPPTMPPTPPTLPPTLPTLPPTLPTLPPTPPTLPTIPPTPPTLPPIIPTLPPTVPPTMPPIFPPVNPTLPPVVPPVVPPITPSCPVDQILFPEIKCDSTNICPGNTDCIAGVCCGYKAPPPIVPKSIAHCPPGQDRVKGKMCNVYTECPGGSQCISGVCCIMTLPKPTAPPEIKIIPVAKPPPVKSQPVIPLEPELPPAILPQPLPEVNPPKILVPDVAPPVAVLPPVTNPTCPAGSEPLLGSTCDAIAACPGKSTCVGGVCCAPIRPSVGKCPSDLFTKVCPAVPEPDHCTVTEDCGPFLTCCETTCGQRVCHLDINPVQSEPRKK